MSVCSFLLSKYYLRIITSLKQNTYIRFRMYCHEDLISDTWLDKFSQYVSLIFLYFQWLISETKRKPSCLSKSCVSYRSTVLQRSADVKHCISFPVVCRCSHVYIPHSYCVNIFNIKVFKLTLKFSFCIFFRNKEIF